MKSRSRKVKKINRPKSKRVPLGANLSKKKNLQQSALLPKGVFNQNIESVEPCFPPVDTCGIPSRYGDNKIVLLVRDPWWIYTYWEVTPERENEVLEAIRRAGQSKEKVALRVYDVTGMSLPSTHCFFDIEIGGLANNWYIDVGKPDREWIVELGVRTREGNFFMLVRSNTVRTPRFGLSDVLDEEWMMPDDLYRKLLSLTGSLEYQKNSLSVREGWERYLRSIASSGSVAHLAVSCKE